MSRFGLMFVQVEKSLLKLTQMSCLKYLTIHTAGEKGAYANSTARGSIIKMQLIL